MWVWNWAKQSFSSNLLSEREFQVLLAKVLSRLERRPRVLNVACLELLGLDALEPLTSTAVVTHVINVLKMELRKCDVLAHTTPNQLALFLPDSSPDEANQILSRMQLEVQGAMQLYHLDVAINTGLFSFEKPLSLAEVTRVVAALLLEASTLGTNVTLQEVAVAAKRFSAPFTVRPSQFDKFSKLA
jgi:GGDEF domain-containing protein